MTEITTEAADSLLRKKALVTRWEKFKCCFHHDWSQDGDHEWRVCDRCFTVERKVFGSWCEPARGHQIRHRRELAAKEMQRVRGEYRS